MLKANRKRRVRVAFPAVVPACGYRVYYAQPHRSGVPATGDDWRVDERGPKTATWLSPSRRTVAWT